MTHVALNRRWLDVSCLLTVLAVFFGRPLTAADDSPSDKPAKGKSAAKAVPGNGPASTADQFAVPDGKPPALMAFIAKMRRLKPPKNASEDDKKAFFTKSHAAMLEAADKILETNPLG